MTRSMISLLTLVALGLACGGEDRRAPGGGGGGGGAAQTRSGKTPCLSVECSPGQYCEGGAICVNGCTSDLNCLPNTQCVDIDSFSKVGQCAAPSGGGGGVDGGVVMQRDASCDGYAAHARECGLLASEAEGIRQVCDQLDANTKRALVACNASTSCRELLMCSNMECFRNEDCPAARPRCLLRTQVVDPLQDVPYTCR